MSHQPFQCLCLLTLPHTATGWREKWLSRVGKLHRRFGLCCHINVYIRRRSKPPEKAPVNWRGNEKKKKVFFFFVGGGPQIFSGAGASSIKTNTAITGRQQFLCGKIGSANYRLNANFTKPTPTHFDLDVKLNQSLLAQIALPRPMPFFVAMDLGGLTPPLIRQLNPFSLWPGFLARAITFKVIPLANRYDQGNDVTNRHIQCQSYWLNLKRSTQRQPLAYPIVQLWMIKKSMSREKY